MREEYEAWFIGKFGYPPMPQHSRVLDFCWHGYQAGRKHSDSEIDRLKGMVDEIGAARKVNSQHDKLLVEIAELRQQLASRDAEIAELRQQVTLLRDAIEAELRGADYGRRAMRKAFENTKPQEQGS